MTADAMLTVQQVADELACHESSIRRAIDAGRLIAFRDGQLLRIRRSSLDAYLEQHTTGRPVRAVRRAS